MSKQLTKCPVCKGKGYFIVPNVSIKRCECCQGLGLASDFRIMSWELSL